MRPRLRAGIIFVVTLLIFWGGFARGAEVSEPNSYVFDLEYESHGQSIHLNLNHLFGRADFQKEPDFGGGKVVKGLIPAGAQEKDYIGYAWDVSAGKLYLDHNRNRDLTDDPNGVFETDRTGRNIYFEKVRFSVKSALLEVPYVAHIGFNGSSYAYMTIRSGFFSEIEVGGRKWQVAVVDNMDGKIGDGDRFVLDWVGEDGGLLRSLGNLPIQDNIFFGSRFYKTAFEFKEKDGKLVLQMRLDELQVPLGKVTIEGKFVKCLVFNNDTTQVILDFSTGESAVPLGRFNYEHLVLEGDKSQKFKVTNFHGGNEFSVSVDEATMVKAGGPLINSVSVQRSGNVLTLGYKLVDAIGNEYGSLYGSRDNPPGFVVYKGDKQLSSGTFEYG
ncbi:MAG: hypothetical protein ACYSWP_11940 [Planctomycetota bacterium]|jgi:hypothetical protein